jgi:hypothetical protein
MGEMSIFASKFNTCSLSLKQYDDALRYLKKSKDIRKNSEMELKVDKILRVINPISEVIQGKLSSSTAIDENSVLNILMQKHEKEWFLYREKLIHLCDKLQKRQFKLTKPDIDILNDLGDALDVECGALFKRLGTR